MTKYKSTKFWESLAWGLLRIKIFLNAFCHFVLKPFFKTFISIMLIIVLATVALILSRFNSRIISDALEKGSTALLTAGIGGYILLAIVLFFGISLIVLYRSKE